LQADGKILVSASVWGDYHRHLALLRYNSDGSVDSGFGSGGVATTDFASADDRARYVAVQPDGKILVAGSVHNSAGKSALAVARLNADGSLDTSFHPSSHLLSGTVGYTENGAAVALAGSVQVYDAELAAQGHYGGASVSLARHGGTDSQDVFSGMGNLSLSGAAAVLSGIAIGAVEAGGGALKIVFNSNATQARVNEALSSLGYANASDSPPFAVQVDWTFSDGNAGAQGAGGALSVLGSTTVNIMPVNDPPTGGVTLAGEAIQGRTLVAANTLADADGPATLAVGYHWQRDGSDIPGATAASHFSVTPVNDPPTAADNTLAVNEDTALAFAAANFKFSDVDGDPLATVEISTLANAGALQYYYSGGAWLEVAAGQAVSKAEIDAGHLRFVPAANANGTGYAHFGFKISDGAAGRRAAGREGQ
jgi:uncharacterized delta-60 repeat protein